MEGLGDSAPVVDAWEKLSDQMKLVEAEEAVGEDDGILWGFCRDSDGLLAENV